MHHFSYRNGVLHAEHVDLRTIAAEVGTPVYVYSSATIARHYRVFSQTVGAISGIRGAHVFYAMKANGNLAVLKLLARMGAGADTVSEGEIRKALAAGIPPERIVFSGVGKSDAELAFAVDKGIYQINIETEGELEALNRIAIAKGRRQAAVFRVNPDVGAGGHAKITTGSLANKFGVSFGEAERLYARASQMDGINMLGLAVHIGSQIKDLHELEAAFIRMRELTEELRGSGHDVERLDLGGGLGIPYELPIDLEHGPDLIEAYAKMIERTLGNLGVELGFEPGRIIVGNAGLLLTKVLHINPRPAKTFLVVDAAMNDLIRPAMYEAYHEIWPINAASETTQRISYDVVGPVCESGDTFTADRSLPVCAPGDLIAFMTAGAYGAAMASSYNQRLLVPEVLVDEDRYAIVRPRQSYEDLIGLDKLPHWLS
jgi:diaminopimelate decarboxylase